MHIAILTFEGFNELDSLIAFGILNRIKSSNWRVSIASPTQTVKSMNGLVIHSQASLAEANAADAVIVGSGVFTREIAQDEAILAAIQLDPTRQLIAAQCSGTLLLSKMHLLDGVAACTDLTTKPWVQESGVEVLNQPFFAKRNIATAGGCLASQYLSFWVIAKLKGIKAAQSALEYVAPVNEKQEYVSRAMQNVGPYLQEHSQ